MKTNNTKTKILWKEELSRLRKRLLLIIIIIYLPSFIYSQNQDSLYNKSLIELQNKLETLKKDVSNINASLENLKEHHAEQANYYEKIINIIFWIVSLVFILAGTGISIFIWLFNKPKTIYNKLLNIKKKANLMYNRIENDFNYQKSLFIFSKKGLYSYTSEDWNMISTYAQKAKNFDEKERTTYDWYFMGLSEYHQKNFSEAIIYLNKAIELDHKFEIALKDLGNAYLEGRDEDSAISCYERVLAINPLSHQAFNNLGIAYASKGEFENARKFYISSLEIDPTEGSVYNNLLELNLVTDTDFETSHVNYIERFFKNDKIIYPVYQMLIIFKKVSKNIELFPLLENWKNNYKLTSNEDFYVIERWIKNKEDVEIKEKLLDTLAFFKGSFKLLYKLDGK
jgi:tetratricopeptide (TPR) repeat protein